MRSEPVWPLHEINAENLIFGRAWFLSIPIGPGWEWRRGPSLPEVDARRERYGQTWVMSGRAWYALVDPERRIGCELTIDIRPGLDAGSWERWTRGMAREPMVIAGHTAEIARGTVARGLLPRRTLEALRVQFGCDRSERTIRIEFVGNFTLEQMAEIQNNLVHLRCH